MEDARLAQLQSKTLVDIRGHYHCKLDDNGEKLATIAFKVVNDNQMYQQQMVTSKKQSKLVEYNTKLPGRMPLTTTSLQDHQQQQQQR
ncbi:unnamed protein product [Absidia cylindrospora]